MEYLDGHQPSAYNPLDISASTIDCDTTAQTVIQLDYGAYSALRGANLLSDSRLGQKDCDLHGTRNEVGQVEDHVDPLDLDGEDVPRYRTAYLNRTETKNTFNDGSSAVELVLEPGGVEPSASSGQVNTSTNEEECKWSSHQGRWPKPNVLFAKIGHGPKSGPPQPGGHGPFSQKLEIQANI